MYFLYVLDSLLFAYENMFYVLCQIMLIKHKAMTTTAIAVTRAYGIPPEVEGWGFCTHMKGYNYIKPLFLG